MDRWIVFMTGLFALALPGCSTPADDFVGTWELQEGTMHSVCPGLGESSGNTANPSYTIATGTDAALVVSDTFDHVLNFDVAGDEADVVPGQLFTANSPANDSYQETSAYTAWILTLSPDGNTLTSSLQIDRTTTDADGNVVGTCTDTEEGTYQRGE